LKPKKNEDMKKMLNYFKSGLLLLVMVSALFYSCEGEVQESTAQDWPQYKKDNHRSANSSIQIDVSTLGEDWVYSAPQLPVPAWYGPAKEDTYALSGPLPSMRDYDLAYYPIIVGEKLYYGSTSDNAVHCINVVTGKEEWTFTTGGPIRVAPTFKSGRLYFGSDDGYVYCIDIKGTLEWKFSPTENKKKKVLNNNALISFWPVRTGVLVESNIAYFGASLLPWKESYFCAVDIKTGKATKPGTYIKKYEDLTLEGSMASTGTKIVQPQGRIPPIFFNKSSGVSQGQLAGTGGCFVLITPELNIVHPQTSREKSIMETIGDDIAKISDGNKIKQAQFMSFKGGKEIVVKDSMSYILTDNSISAYNRNLKKVTWTKLDYQAHRMIISGDIIFLGGTDKVYAVSSRNGYPIWEASVKGTVYALAVANNAVYASTGEGHIYKFSAGKGDNSLYNENKDKLATIEKKRKVGIQEEEGTLKFAAGPFVNALGPDSIEVYFVSEKPMKANLSWTNDYGKQEVKEDKAATEHRIVVKNVRKDFKYKYCITVGEEKSKLYDYDNFFNYIKSDKKYDLKGDASELIKEINAKNKGEKGLAVVFGTENKDMALEIANNTPLKVFIFETSDSKVIKYREQLQSTEIYGSKISVQLTKSYNALPLTSDAANIVVVNDTDDVNVDEVIRLVKPEGYAIVPKKGNDLNSWTSEANNMWQVSHTNGGSSDLLKKAPYETAGKWTHQYGLPDNSAFGGESLWGSTSTDDFEIQWMGRPGPRFQTDRSGRKASPLAVDGKMFVQGKERVIAVDAYDGHVLWSKEMPGLVRMNVHHDCSNWAADDDYIYAIINNNLIKVDHNNGRIAKIIPVEKSVNGISNDWGYISIVNDIIIGSAIQESSNYTDYYGNVGWYDKQSGPATFNVMSFSLFGKNTNGVNIWKYEKPKSAIINSTITISNNQISFIESRNVRLTQEGRGDDSIFNNLFMVSLNVETGKVNWEKPIKNMPGLAVYYMAGSKDFNAIVSSQTGKYHVYVYNTTNGDLVWDKEQSWYSDNHGGHLSKPAIVKNKLIVKPAIYKLDSGELLENKIPKAGHGCATYALSEQSAFYRGGSVTQYNFDTDKFSKWERLRPDCWLSTIPAQGLVLSPEAGGGCSCGNWLETSMVFTPISRAPISFLYSEDRFRDTVSVAIKSRDILNKEIYYTLDGSEPTKSSNKYREPIMLSEAITLKTAIYVEKNGSPTSFIRTKEFVREYPEPIIGEYPLLIDGQWIFAIEREGVSGVVHYTVDGAEPTLKSTKYVKPVVMIERTLVKAKTFWTVNGKQKESEETSFELEIPELIANVNKAVKPGVSRAYYKDASKKEKMYDLGDLKPKGITIVKDLSNASFKKEKMYALRYSGYINIPMDGMYTLSGISKNSYTIVSIHNSKEIESKGDEEVSKVIPLKKGLHPIIVDCFVGKNEGDYSLSLEGPNMPKTEISGDLLFTRK
jgi:outer membrane protein assembly factor BamB